jgi:gamma-glutamylputrescine oxidase
MLRQPTPLDPFPKAAGAISCDVCVVGGGCPDCLRRSIFWAGYDVVLLDAQRVGFGASNNGG